MTLREALVLAIDCLQENRPDDKQAAKAVRILSAKANVLRLRKETVAPATREAASQFFDGEITIPAREILDNLRAQICKCSKPKGERTAFCPACWLSISPVARCGIKMFRFGNGFEQAYEAALMELGFHPQQQPANATSPTPPPSHCTSTLLPEGSPR